MTENDGTFTIDFSDFNRNIEKLSKLVLPFHAGNALRKVAQQIIADAINQEPTVPKGHYRAKAGRRVGVGGELRASQKVEMDGDFSVSFGFNVPYAAYQHKGERKDGSHKVKKYSEAGAGKEFLVKKMIQNKEVYLKNVAEYLEKHL